MLISLFFLSVALAQDAPDFPVNACVEDRSNDTDYVVCHFAGDADIRLFLNDGNGKAFRHFNRVNEDLSKTGEVLAFAMNAGMYHDDRSPVGHYVERGVQVKSLNTNDGPGNFHMKPNGVFWTYFEHGMKGVGISVSEKLAGAAPEAIHYATQSGPMLVIDGEIHHRFIRDSDSRKRRNGVGVTDSGDVFFVLADSPVNFYDFAHYFRDVLGTKNALYLDGTISRIYAPALDRNDPGAAMGPIIGVVTDQD